MIEERYDSPVICSLNSFASDSQPIVSLRVWLHWTCAPVIYGPDEGMLVAKPL